MSFVKFKNQIDGEDFSFKCGVAYEIVGEDQEYYFIKQPNSPKNKNWVSQFPKNIEGIVYEVY